MGISVGSRGSCRPACVCGNSNHCLDVGWRSTEHINFNSNTGLGILSDRVFRSEAAVAVSPNKAFKSNAHYVHAAQLQR